MTDDFRMLTPLDPAALPKNVIALRTLLLHREGEHAAELQQHVADLTAARNGLREQVLRNEQLKLRLAKLLRERFGASSERLRGEIEQLELLLGELEEQVAELIARRINVALIRTGTVTVSDSASAGLIPAPERASPQRHRRPAPGMGSACHLAARLPAPRRRQRAHPAARTGSARCGCGEGQGTRRQTRQAVAAAGCDRTPAAPPSTGAEGAGGGGAASWPANLAPLGLGQTTIGALLPDIDHLSSWVGRRF
jgi:Transposase C of IS166 homeodomain